MKYLLLSFLTLFFVTPAFAQKAINMTAGEMRGFNINPVFHARNWTQVEGPQDDENWKEPKTIYSVENSINISGEELFLSAASSYVGQSASMLRVMVANDRHPKGNYMTQSFIQWVLDNTDKKVMISDFSAAHMGQLDRYGLIRAAYAWAGMRNFLNANKDRILLNVVNEPTRHSVSDWEWRQGSIAAIQILRYYGVENTLVINGNSWGQGSAGILAYGADIYYADVLQDVVFSFHPYTFSYWESEELIKYKFQLLKNTGLPIVIGEYGPREPIDYTRTETQLMNVIVRESIANGFGYFAWSWSQNANINWARDMDMAYFVTSNADHTYYYNDNTVRKYILPRPLYYGITDWGNLVNWHLQGMP